MPAIAMPEVAEVQAIARNKAKDKSLDVAKSAVSGHVAAAKLVAAQMQIKVDEENVQRKAQQVRCPCIGSIHLSFSNCFME